MTTKLRVWQQLYSGVISVYGRGKIRVFNVIRLSDQCDGMVNFNCLFAAAVRNNGSGKKRTTCPSMPLLHRTEQIVSVALPGEVRLVGALHSVRCETEAVLYCTRSTTEAPRHNARHTLVDELALVLDRDSASKRTNVCCCWSTQTSNV